MVMTTAAPAFDVVDTSGQEEVILLIDAARARREMALDDRFARVVRDLVLGMPVAGCELDQWGIQAIGLLDDASALESRARQDQYELGLQ